MDKKAELDMACTMPENTLGYYTDFRASRAYHPEYEYNNPNYNGGDIVSTVPSVRFDEIFKKADPRKVQCITLRLLKVEKCRRVLAALRNIIKLLQKCPNCIYFELILFEYPDHVLLDLDWKYGMDCRFHDLFYIIRSKCSNLRTVVIESLNATHTRTLSHLFSSPHLERLELYKFNDEAMTQNYALKELIIPMYMENTNPRFTFIYSSVQLSKKDIENLEHIHSCRQTLCWLSNSRHVWCGERETRQIKMLLLYNSCRTQYWLPPELIQLILGFYFS